MSQFLIVVKKVVVDQAFQPAVPEVPEVPAVLDPDTGDVITPAVPAVPAVPEVPLITHDEFDKCYIETAPAAAAKILAEQADDPNMHSNLTVYSIKINATTLRPTIRNARIKSRAPKANPPEVITIEDQDGTELGAGEI